MSRWKFRVAAQTAIAGVMIVPALRAQTAGYSEGLYDTLVAVVGAPTRFTVKAIPPMLMCDHSTSCTIMYVSAHYISNQDAIEIDTGTMSRRRHTPAATADNSVRFSPDWTIAHEFGHRFDSMREREPSELWLRFGQKTVAGSWYANANAAERFAEAFANAIDFLRWSSMAPPRRIVAALAHREWFVPGTTYVIGLLLEHPLYAAHPLNTGRRS